MAPSAHLLKLHVLDASSYNSPGKGHAESCLQLPPDPIIVFITNYSTRLLTHLPHPHPPLTLQGRPCFTLKIQFGRQIDLGIIFFLFIKRIKYYYVNKGR